MMLPRTWVTHQLYRRWQHYEPIALLRVYWIDSSNETSAVWGLDDAAFKVIELDVSLRRFEQIPSDEASRALRKIKRIVAAAYHHQVGRHDSTHRRYFSPHPVSVSALENRP